MQEIQRTPAPSPPASDLGHFLPLVTALSALTFSLKIYQMGLSDQKSGHDPFLM